MRQQYELTFQIGYFLFDPHFEAAIVNYASSLCGGCTVVQSKGFWKDDGADKKATFSGQLQQEHCFNLQLTCEEEKVHNVLGLMRLQIAARVQQYKIDTQWVHVKKVEFTGLHFDVQAIIEDNRNQADIRDIISPGTRGAR